ncbi:hypothetical protein MTP99_001299 [Tenebrio molitor]|nr:hypothetical protein MTP99_001299 [Tenebrio molitor]
MRHTILLFASALITIIGASGILEKSIFPPLPVAVLDANDTTCKKESEIYIKNLDNFTLWAYEMWDATAKSPAGVLRGSVFQMGHFEQCLMTEAPFLTKYCLIRFTANVPKPKQNRDSISLYHHPNEHIVDKIYPYKDVSQQARNVIQVGWCIPASCSTQDLETFLRSYVNELDLPLKQDNVTYDTRVSELTCHTKRDKESFTAADISFW